MTDNAYPNGELRSLIDQQRADTSRWQNGENHSPNPNVDPNSLSGNSEMPDVERISETSVESGPKVEKFVAKVFTSSENNIEGAKVLLQDGEFHVVGNVALEAEDGFVVEWRTGRKSIEKKAHYELVVVAAEDDECPKHPGQPKVGCEGCEAYEEFKRQDRPDPLDDDSIYGPSEN